MLHQAFFSRIKYFVIQQTKFSLISNTGPETLTVSMFVKVNF